MAEENDDASKTEEPTDKKLADARKKGQVATSKEVGSFFVLLGGTIMILLMAPGMAEGVMRVVIPFVERPDMMEMNGPALLKTAISILQGLAFSIGLPILMLLVFGVLGHVVQNGLLFAGERIKPDLGKINPLKGLKNIFGMKNLVEIFKAILKLVLVGLILVLIITPELDNIPAYTGFSLKSVIDELYDMTAIMLIVVLSLTAIIAALDFSYQKYEFKKRMRMTQQEVKDEHKQMEGSPEIKAKIRQIRNERAQQRMMQAVPTADVVVTNPTHYAVALKYDIETMAAPVCVAKGQDNIALKIRDVAEENDVVIMENPPVARALYATVEIDQQVPPEHYQAVAEIISYVYKLKKRKF